MRLSGEIWTCAVWERRAAINRASVVAIFVTIFSKVQMKPGGCGWFFHLLFHIPLS